MDESGCPTKKTFSGVLQTPLGVWTTLLTLTGNCSAFEVVRPIHNSKKNSVYMYQFINPTEISITITAGNGSRNWDPEGHVEEGQCGTGRWE